MSPEVAHDLQLLDKEALSSAKRKHVLAEAARVAHRLRVSTVGPSASAGTPPTIPRASGSNRKRARGSRASTGASGAYEAGCGD